MLLALGFSPGATLAFVMAAGFIADTSSLPLIVSNLVNIVTADFFTLGFSEYASVMVPVNMASVVATLVMLHLFFRKDIPAGYDLTKLKMPRDAIRDRRTFKTGWLVLILLLAGFLRWSRLAYRSAWLRQRRPSFSGWLHAKDTLSIPVRC